MVDESNETQGVIGAGTPTESCDLLIRNAYVLTMDPHRTVFPIGAVAISGRTITAVGPDRELAERFQARRTINAEGGPVHPGMFDCHVHVTLHATRGAFPDIPGIHEGQAYFYRWFDAITDEDEYASSLLACLEMLRNGVTSFMEPGTVFEPDTTASAAKAVGIRGSVTDPFIWDATEYFASTLMTRARPDPAASNRMGKQLWRNKDPEAMIRGHIGLYGAATASDQLTLAAKACADENGTFFNQHQSFEFEDVGVDDKRHGKHALVHYGDLGVLGPNSSFVHMNVIREDEVRPVVDSGMSLVWCPANAMYWDVAGKAPTRMPQFYREGVSVAFGTDSPKVWGSSEQGFVGYLMARVNGDYLHPEQILEMSTIQGARVMGMEDLTGSLEAGKRADVVVRSDLMPEAQPDSNVVRNLVLVSRSKSVDTVIVDGQVVVEGGHSTLVDEEEVYAKARESVRVMLGRIDVHPGTSWPLQG